MKFEHSRKDGDKIFLYRLEIEGNKSRKWNRKSQFGVKNQAYLDKNIHRKIKKILTLNFPHKNICLNTEMRKSS